MRFRPVLLVVMAVAAFTMFFGLAILAAEVAEWLDRGRWISNSLLELIQTPAMQRVLPGSFLSWLRRPQFLFGLHRFAVFVLETVPSWVFLIGAGGSMLWATMRR